MPKLTETVDGTEILKKISSDLIKGKGIKRWKRYTSKEAIFSEKLSQFPEICLKERVLDCFSVIGLLNFFTGTKRI